MSTIYKCDICGKEMARVQNKITLTKNEVKTCDIAQTVAIYADEQPIYDVCPDCYEKIKQKLDNNTIKSDSCYTCRYHKSCNPDEYPCSQCSHNYTSQYEHE